MTIREKKKYEICREINRLNREIKTIKDTLKDPQLVVLTGSTKTELNLEYEELIKERNQLLTSLL